MIIDGSSTDGTAQYLKSLKAPFFYLSEPDQGVYEAMNKGIARSKGEWLYFLGSDDQLFDNEVLESIFNKPIVSKAKIIIGKVQYDLKNNKAVYTHNKEGLVNSRWSKLIWFKNVLHHQAAFYHCSLFKQLRYSLDYKFLADHALNLHLFKQKTPVHFNDKLIALCGAEGKTKNFTWAMYREEVDLKVKASSILFKPLFMLLAIAKYLFKKI